MRLLHWFRKDLRLDDNTALARAHDEAGGNVVAVYISEPSILARPDLAATRIRFVLDALADLDRNLGERGGRLIVRHGDAAAELVALCRETGADAVSWNDEYEPELRTRDEAVARALEAAGIGVRRAHDRFLVPPGTVRNAAGEPFVVYTPFRKASERLPVATPFPRVTKFVDPGVASRRLATLAELGLATEQAHWPSGEGAARRALDAFVERSLFGYVPGRDRLDAEGTSMLSPHLRFGTLSARQAYHAVAAALESAGRTAGPDARASVEQYIAELRWRDFYGHVLFHFPHVAERSFRPAYDAIRWRDDDDAFAAWCAGRTGYPVVDAALRQLAATGWMHNRARMIVASFLAKDLLLDWRRGERWFMNRLVDGDPASNNGGWQWAAGTGTDAQPYFRIFNPVLQGRKFDPDGAYVRRWVPELAGAPKEWIHDPWTAAPLERAAAGVTLGETYPHPICDHAERREAALRLYAEARDASDASGAPPRR
jgi:deoxyribodipyrimidine photo-lyase